MLICQQLAIYSAKKAPVETVINTNGVTVVFQYFFVCSKKNMVIVKTNIPYICKIIVFGRDQFVKRSIFQFTICIRKKISDLTLPANIDPVIIAYSYRAGNRFIG